MKNIKINQNEAQSLFKKLSKDYVIIAPVERKGKGSFSDTNLLTYGEVKSFDEIDFSRQTFFSPKAILFPTRETFFRFQNNHTEETVEDTSPVIVFLRACDIHAISVMDDHFLRDGAFKDPYYEKRRNKVKFFLIECPQSFENCYCVSMQTNKTDDYAAFIRRSDEGYEARIKDNALESYFPQDDHTVEGPKFAEKNIRSVTIPENIDVSLFENDMWQEYSARCIACGRCNTSCPTCTCFSVHDIACEDSSAIERKRIWSSCHVKKFSLLAGGHDFRKKSGDRMRYKTLHKISDFHKRHGRQMCIGCGRCDDVCPVYISMFKCIDKLNEVINNRERHE